jgi:hypothetical protein
MVSYASSPRSVLLYLLCHKAELALKLPLTGVSGSLSLG